MHLIADFFLRQGDFTLEVGLEWQGSAFGIFGPSGAGKSTLLRAMAGLVKPERGYFELNGEVLFDRQRRIWVPPHRRRIGVVFQEARLFPHWSVEKNLRAGFRRVEASEPIAFEPLVQLLELQPLLKRSVEALSGGEMQRVALGRALLAQPRLLLMDEPVSGLDAKRKEQILPFLVRVHRELHLPCVMVSHHLSELLQLTDRLVRMENGRVLAECVARAAAAVPASSPQADELADAFGGADAVG